MKQQNKLYKIIALLTIFLFLNVQLTYALPDIREVESGEVSVETPDANTMNITASANTIINYNSFNIGVDEVVVVTLPTENDAILNRDLSGLRSDLLGELYCNGTFVLTNPAGIYVGEAASLNAANLILSTREILSTDFLNGNYLFRKLNDNLDGMLVNNGTITVHTGGFIAFIAGAMENNGTIIAPVGRVALAGGDAIEIDISGKGRLFVVIKEEAASKILDFQGNPITDQIRNTGTIEAEGGAVILTAESVYKVFDNAINLGGVVRASGMEEQDGVIYITADGNVVSDARMEATYIKIGDPEGSVPENVYITGGDIDAEKGIEVYADNDLEIYADMAVTDGDIKLEYDFDEDGEGEFDHVVGLMYVRRNGNIYLNGEPVFNPVLPLYFIPNLGQVGDEDVLYYVVADGNIYYFTSKGVYYFLLEQFTGEDGIQMAWLSIYMDFIGAGFDMEITPGMSGGAVFNYFHGNDPSGYYTDVPSYLNINYKDLYDGIDLNYSSNEGDLESFFLLKPGADHNDIRIKYNNVQSMGIDEQGNLVIGTETGELVEMAPFAYQTVNGEVVEVECEFMLLSDDTYGFRLGEHDPSSQVVIDPDLHYSSYLGGADRDVGNGIVVDSSGSVYVAGYSQSNNFPTTAGAYQTALSGTRDVIVSKFDTGASGASSLLWSTYLGGTSTEEGEGIALNSTGNPVITGSTNSNDFPTTAGAYDTIYNGGGDVFITELNSDGNALVFSTYLGGAGSDTGYGIVLDSSDDIYVAGTTLSNDFPTVNAYQAAIAGARDVFLSKLNSTATALSYSTYLGGTGNDYGRAVAVDSSANAFVTGYTYSNNYPTSAGAYQTVMNGTADAFVTKVHTGVPWGAATLVYSTYVGGTSYDDGKSIILDSSGNAYFTGQTWSNNYPTASPYQAALASAPDAVITKVNPTGTGLLYSTYLGGTSNDYGYGLVLDSSGNIYVTGNSSSTNFPTTIDRYQAVGNSGDAFLTELNSAGDTLVYSTGLGGTSSFDNGYAVALGNSDQMIVITGLANSNDFPTTAGAYQAASGGDYDVFVAMFGTAPAPPAPKPTPAPEVNENAVNEATRPVYEIREAEVSLASNLIYVRTGDVFDVHGNFNVLLDTGTAGESKS